MIIGNPMASVFTQNYIQNRFINLLKSKNDMMFKKKITKYFLISLLFFLVTFLATAQHDPEFSKAGFYPLEHTGRDVFSMNVAWRFHKGALNNAEAYDLKDNNWTVINLPNGIE